MSPRLTVQHPCLGRALKLLRIRAGLTQREVVERVRTANEGVRLSNVWYSKLEHRDDVRPTETLLTAILAVLGSTRAEFDELLAELLNRSSDHETWSDEVHGEPPPASSLNRSGDSPALSDEAQLIDIFVALAAPQRQQLLSYARELRA